MRGWAFRIAFIILLGSAGYFPSTNSAGQDIQNCIIPGNITNNQAPVIINMNDCNIVLPEKLGPAEVRFISPKLIDVRTIIDPESVPSEGWMEASPVLSVERMAYEHVTQPAVRAQIHAEEAYLVVGPTMLRFRAFQWVDIGETGKGWLGRTGDARPFAIDPGAVESHTTQFKATDRITWRELVGLLESQTVMKVVVFARVSQSNAAPGDAVAMIRTECTASLELTQQQIAQARQKKGRLPKYVQVICEGG